MIYDMLNVVDSLVIFENTFVEIKRYFNIRLYNAVPSLSLAVIIHFDFFLYIK